MTWIFFTVLKPTDVHFGQTESQLCLSLQRSGRSDMQSESVNGIPWEVNKLRMLFNVWTQTGKAADRERERDERILIIGALDSEVDTWTMRFRILNTNSTKHNP